MREDVQRKPRWTDHSKFQRAGGWPKMPRVVVAVAYVAGKIMDALRSGRRHKLPGLIACRMARGFVMSRNIAASL